jgi:hypothetical protein
MALAVPLPGTGYAPARPARTLPRPRRAPGRGWWLRLAASRKPGGTERRGAVQ